MPRLLSEEDLTDFCQDAKDWVANKPFKEDFKNRIAAKIDSLQSWDLQVSSNAICRYLKGKVELDLPVEPDHEDVADCIAALIAIAAMQVTHKIPAVFYNWDSPAHWDEILTVVNTFLKTNRVCSKWLEKHILEHANVIPADHLKRAREMLVNEKDGSLQKKLKADAVFMEAQLREKDARIVDLMQKVQSATTVVNTLRTRRKELEAAKATSDIAIEALSTQVAALEKEKITTVKTISQMQITIDKLEKEKESTIANQPVGSGRGETAATVKELEKRLDGTNELIEQLRGDLERAVSENMQLFAEKQKFEKDAQKWKTRFGEARTKSVLGDKSAYMVPGRRQE